MERKYQYYIIKIIYKNGDTEELNSFKSNSNINSSSYKEMLKVYNEVKELYRDKDCNISFCGVGQDGSLGILFTKECHKEYNKETKSIYDIIELLKEAYDIYSSRIPFIDSMIDVYNKKCDEILHRIELSKDADDSIKIDIFNQIQQIRDKRRKLKYEKEVARILKDVGMLGAITKTMQHVNRKENRIKKCESGDEKALKKTKVYEFNYKNFKDRIRIMKEIQKKYDKITYDNNKIYAYNKCGVH